MTWLVQIQVHKQQLALEKQKRSDCASLVVILPSSVADSFTLRCKMHMWALISLTFKGAENSQYCQLDGKKISKYP